MEIKDIQLLLFRGRGPAPVPVKKHRRAAEGSAVRRCFPAHRQTRPGRPSGRAGSCAHKENRPGSVFRGGHDGKAGALPRVRGHAPQQKLLRKPFSSHLVQIRPHYNRPSPPCQSRLFAAFLHAVDRKFTYYLLLFVMETVILNTLERERRRMSMIRVYESRKHDVDDLIYGDDRNISQR